MKKVIFLLCLVFVLIYPNFKSYAQDAFSNAFREGLRNAMIRDEMMQRNQIEQMRVLDQLQRSKLEKERFEYQKQLYELEIERQKIELEKKWSWSCRKAEPKHHIRHRAN